MIFTKILKPDRNRILCKIRVRLTFRNKNNVASDWIYFAKLKSAEKRTVRVKGDLLIYTRTKNPFRLKRLLLQRGQKRLEEHKKTQLISGEENGCVWCWEWFECVTYLIRPGAIRRACSLAGRSSIMHSAPAPSLHNNYLFFVWTNALVY